ncbi:MAG TPA: PPC domain-containing DNA-binding protein [Acidimicrobiia bacterium]|nr:PPC domain-containing DNA-binding protein [Acidimicrobiia bacterium]
MRLDTGDDILATITRYAADNGIRAAWFTYLGAVSTAAVRYYDQNDKVYRDFTIDRHLEVLSGVGNVSLLDGAPFVHTHAAFADEDGHAFGGHLNTGCIVFGLEIRLEELSGDPPVRLFDEPTGLSLWGDAD